MKMRCSLLLLLLYYTMETSGSSCTMGSTYVRRYSCYGYVISCDQLDVDELQTIPVYNELILTITNSVINLEPQMFRNMRKLRELNITNSAINFTDGTTFRTFTRLMVLTLQNNRLKNFTATYLSGLDTLRKLNLPKNELTGFDKGTFIGMDGIQMLDLSENAITKISDLNLCDLINLERLYLSKNKISRIEPNILACFSDLRYLYLDHNHIKSLDTFLSMTITELYLSHNEITNVNYINATNLEKLDLSSNKLTKIEASSFIELPNLETLYLSNNSIYFIDPVAYQANNKLKYLNIDMNHLKWIYLEIPSLEHLSVTNNKLQALQTANITHLIHLKLLNLSDNHISRIENDVFRKMNSLRYLNLRGNHLRENTFIFDTTSLLNVLDLSRNNLTTLCECTFKNLKGLKTLDLSFNHLGDLNDTVFTDLISLKVLNMSYNQMTNFDYEVVNPLKNLRTLDVVGNLLTNIDYNLILSELPNLGEFNVNNNLLSCEFLGKMFTFFKEKNISITVIEQIKYDKENVAGIYCKETERKLISLEEAKVVLYNNTKMLNDLYSKSQNNVGTIKVYGIVLFVVIILLIFFGLLAVYRCQVWNRRKNYIMDELELITNEPYKTFDGH